jgi:glycosyltransferase involved in cell wall biosynthesis
VTKLNIISDNNEPLETFSFNSSPPVDEQSKNAMGGTEMMKYGLYDRLPVELKERFNIICSRVRELHPSKYNLLWLHDLAEDPEADHLRKAESRDRFKKLIMVSNWQMNNYNKILGVPYDDCVVLKNAIVPFEPHTKPDVKEQVNIIYHTTPHRGLELLVPVIDALVQKEEFKNIHLDVYSSFKIYGWEIRDEPYRELFQKIKDHPNMTYHGSVSNYEIRQALKKAHIFAYPSIWPETSCIAAMEAMSAGCVVVAPNYGALPETLANFGIMYQWSENKHNHANMFANTLAQTIQIFKNNPDAMVSRLSFQKSYADSFYSWELRIKEWEGLLNNIIKFPDGLPTKNDS